MSAGYRYDFKNGLLKETGSLSIDILPKNTSVYLEGLKIDQTIPIRLNNITPHKYALRLSSPGYYEWEKQIEINKNQTTYIKELVLIKKSKAEEISKKTTSAVSVSPSGKYIVFASKNGSQTEISIYNSETSAENLFLKIPYTGDLKFNWSPYSEYFSISSVNEPHNVLYVVNASNPKRLFNLISENSSSIEKFIWSKDLEPKMYFEANSRIKSYLARLDQTSTVASSTFQDWYVDDGSLWILNYNNEESRLEIISDYLGFKNIYNSIGVSNNTPSSTLKSFKLESVKKNTVVLGDREAGKYYIVESDKYYPISGKKLLYSKYNNWLLAWNAWELWTYSEGDEPYLLNRSGEELFDAVPIDQYNTLALVWKNRVTALHPYFLTERTIIEETVNDLAANDSARIIYYGTNNGLWKLSY